jgi:hypothetical protein
MTKGKIELCDQKIAKSLFTSARNKEKPRDIGFTDIDKKKYILKTEDVEESLSKMSEYQFYKKVSKKIYKEGFELNLQVPITYKVCKDTENRSDPSKKKDQIFYLFHVLKGDLSHKVITSIPIKEAINMYQQYLLSLYFLNHKLGYYHNDFFTNYKLMQNRSLFNINNFMYMKNPKKTNNVLKVDGMECKVGKYRGMIIDFGLCTKFPNNYGYKLKVFYGILSLRLFYRFKYYSEMFLVFILLYHTYVGDFRLYQIKNYYQFFESKMYGKQTLKDFDRSVYKNFHLFFDKEEMKRIKEGKKQYKTSSSKS